MSDPIRRRGSLPPNPDGNDVVSTPEGDGEYTPDELVGPVEGLQVAGGNGPLPYESDKPTDANGDVIPEQTGGVEDKVEKTVDKLSLGQILT